MTTTFSQALVNPYVGPRSFQQGERLYGRDREAKDLLGLLIAERIVLLHSPSGAGKTSLLQAAVIPQLRANEFSVLPTIRVSLELNERDADAVERAEERGAQLLVGDAINWAAALRSAERPNRYVISALLSLEDDLPPEQRTATDELRQFTLDTYLSRREEQLGDRDIVLIFDQFEEVLTIDPTDTAAKAAFFAQLGMALRNRGRWALFAMREDYVASLAPYLRPIPTRLSTTFRLDLLDSSAARMAVQQPAALRGVHFSPEAARRLIDDLRRTQVQLADGRVELQFGPHVEPVQLQVVCLRLWEKLAAQRGWQQSDEEAIAPSPQPAAFVSDDDIVVAAAPTRTIDTITVGDVETIGNVDNALATYYADKVSAVAAETSSDERQIREWFDRELITAQGLRGQVLQSAEHSAGLANTTIGELIDSYLVRGEKRRGMTWFELSHDRLVAPVRENNAQWFRTNLSTLQRQADLYG
ncbi:hypothetical protein HC891_19295, partial [Candidatus Gracilibacteria bacterium]|nr:hypothetical protein [Candidatus Gracilibacteria bacterium]